MLLAGRTTRATQQSDHGDTDCPLAAVSSKLGWDVNGCVMTCDSVTLRHGQICNAVTVREADNGHWPHYTLTITLIMSSKTVVSISISSYLYDEKLCSHSLWAGLEWII